MDKLTIATYDRTIRTSFSNGNSNCSEYKHEHYKRNKDRYKSYYRNFYERSKNKVKIYNKEYYEKNKDKIRNLKKIWCLKKK